MPSSIHDILEELRAISYDKHDQGSRFERLMQAYLSLEPQYVDLYDEVWLWKDYPRRDGRTDTGIDLVAHLRASDEYMAIQCKFFDLDTTVTKPMLDSFLSASSKTYDGQPEFTGRLVISTSDKWGKNAEEAVENQNPPVTRLRVQDLDDSSIDWTQFSLANPGTLVKKAHKIPFPHQQNAIDKVLAGFAEADRGKLIMACGTGKTYTSLQIVQQLVPAGGTVLFLVPSIALLGQTLKEWTIEADIPLRSFAVCSDVSVGKRKDEEDTPVVDLAYPSTTNTTKLVEQFKKPPQLAATVTVIFSTYQSIDVVAQAQKDGLPEFDLIVCDEAHRTTGVTLAGKDESAFVRVHNQAYIQGKRRLYMTATPRIYADSSRTKAEEAGAVLADMDDSTLYGEEFHRLSFGEAVNIGRLTDYKVLVLAVDETYVSRRFQRLLADDNNELTLDDAAKIVGCWNGLSKRALTSDEFKLDPEPMKRAVAFARSINESKQIAQMFSRVVGAEIAAIDQASDDEVLGLLEVEAHHVDGTNSVLERNQEIDWLKQDPGEGHARVLTNARCLSEGVDVPSLDAVMFLNPRDSVVDVVQSVGRVMRKLEGKTYGYVILPIGVPSDVDPSEALNDNKKYRVVWQVLQALRAHDERFDAEVNKIDLTGKTNKLQVGIIGKGSGDSDEEKSQTDYGSVTLEFPNFDQWRDAILAKIVDKVGERRYWENWAKDVVGIAEDHMARITGLVDGSDATLREAFARFLKGLQDNLNPYITQKDAIEMLSQHLITKPVFDALFEGYAFSEHNPVSLVMQGMIDALEGQHLDKETERLEKFYESVRTRAEGITDAAAKQTIVKELYERFFKTAFSGTSDRLGIVYTPNEIVDFIVHSVDEALKTEFGASISDEGVHVLDPFTGTGTFIVRLLSSGLIKPEDLAHKYRYELHANELVLLAYYVAAINIEETYHSLLPRGSEYEPFDGIVLTDTFQMSEDGDQDELEGMEVFPENNERVEAQKKLDIRVIMGNPPYFIANESGNDATEAYEYPTLDRRIAETYAADSSAKLTKSLKDSYIRAMRWSSDRIGDRGVVCFVSNGGFIDSNSADSMRKSLASEFNSVYILNLRGNQRTAGEASRREGGKVFGSGSRATVAIYLLVKNPDQKTRGKIFYFEVEDYLTREQKLKLVADARSYRSVEWREVVPNEAGDWINHRTEHFETLELLASKVKAEAAKPRVLGTFSAGLKTNRDAWVYSFSGERLEANVNQLIQTYNLEVDKLQGAAKAQDKKIDVPFLRSIVTRDGKKMKWDGTAEDDAVRGKKFARVDSAFRSGIYRPFQRQHVYMDRQLNNSVYVMPRLFPAGEENWGFYITAPGSGHRFSVLAVDSIPDLALWGSGSGQFFPRYRFEEPEELGMLAGVTGGAEGTGRIDNVTDEVLSEYQATYGSAVTKDDIFYYVYGILHSPDYREQFEADLKKMLPRVPKVKEFQMFADAGQQLAELHLKFDEVEPYDLIETKAAGATYRVTRMHYAKSGKVTDKTTIVYNSGVTLSGIPLEAQEYMLASRSGLDWLLERFQVREDSDSAIVSDPNEWIDELGNERWLVDLIRRIVTVSLGTMEIVSHLPSISTVEETKLEPADTRA